MNNGTSFAHQLTKFLSQLLKFLCNFLINARCQTYKISKTEWRTLAKTEYGQHKVPQ